MNQKTFKVIKGGEAYSSPSQDKKFISAYATNTRLMGVMVLCIKWEMLNQAATENFYQLFYFDAEEYGLDRYEGISSKSMELLEETETSMIGGLGGEKVEVSYDEAICLLARFVEYNRANCIVLPGKASEYVELAKLARPLTLPERNNLYSKICGPIKSQYHLINYFMMRYFGKDFEAAAFLAEGFEIEDLHPQIQFATMLQNSIDPIEGKEGEFMCETLLENDDRHLILTGQVKTNGSKVIFYKPISAFNISSIEAALILNEPEYITLVNYSGDPAAFNRKITKRLMNAMINQHGLGKTFVLFNPTNEHVNRKVYRIYNDLFGVYYQGNQGEILITSNASSRAALLEMELLQSDIGPMCQVQARYHFSNQVLINYIDSGFRNFKEFLDHYDKE